MEKKHKYILIRYVYRVLTANQIVKCKFINISNLKTILKEKEKESKGFKEAFKKRKKEKK